MAQPSTVEANGSSVASAPLENGHLAVPGKRKREDGTDEDGIDAESKPSPAAWPAGDQTKLIQAYYQVLTSLDANPLILKRPLGESTAEDEPRAKRQKSADEPLSIADKMAAGSYQHMEQVGDDLRLAIQSALSDPQVSGKDGQKEQDAGTPKATTRAEIKRFSEQAMDLFLREQAYPRTSFQGPTPDFNDQGIAVLTVSGLAPQERRLFSSLPASKATGWDEKELPAGVALGYVKPSHNQERALTLGETFASPRTLQALQPPKQPKTQAKGNVLDFYHPDLTDLSRHRGNTYFSTKLSAGQFLDYSHATASSQTVSRRHERAQSLAGKKPSTDEAEAAEMEALFRGAFSSFAPCKDDTAALVPSNTAGRMWWQRSGQRQFQAMIDAEYYGIAEGEEAPTAMTDKIDLDESAVQEAIDNWDDSAIDPSLDAIMGAKRDDDEKDADEILDEVSDMIETLASYQRIRNLTLPNSQNRQTSDPVQGDMLATAAPQPSEEELAAYEVLKAQLALIIKTLPPYAVAKLNSDQLEELLVSTKVQVQSDTYKGVMEEDDAAVQARFRAQQAAQANARPAGQRTPSIPNVATPYANQFPPGPQYATPNRTPSHSQQYQRPNPMPNYQQSPRSQAPGPGQQPPRQPNQYSRPNGYSAQFATQLAKTQTPYGHQSMPQYGGQQRPPPNYGQMPPAGTPNMRYNQMQQGFPQQPPGTPTPQGSYGGYTNGGDVGRAMSPQMPPNQHNHSPSPTLHHPPRYGTPGQPQPHQQQVSGNRPPSGSPGPHHGQAPGQAGNVTGYHTVIPEAQQQRILDQAKARVAAQERSASFGDRMAQPGAAGLAGIGLGGSPGGQRPGQNGTPPLAQQVPAKVTPVPVPVIPGAQTPHKPSV